MFNGPMVKAILRREKSVTRRPVRGPVRVTAGIGIADRQQIRDDDRLWVKETWSAPARFDKIKPSAIDPETTSIRYSADGAVLGRRTDFGDTEGRLVLGRQRPSIFMPRWASRLTLDVTSVSLERLHAIDSDDAILEGFGELSQRTDVTPLEAFRSTWDLLNAGRGIPWIRNPWVWRIAFEVSDDH